MAKNHVAFCLPRRRFWHNVLVAVLLAFALAAMAHTLFFGLEIDEEYALSISWRLVKGDHLFLTMWEPHQLSALPVAALLALFYAVTGGTTGILLFVRVVALAAKAVLAAVFYREFSGRLGRAALPAALVLFLYTPKWFLAPDYISQQFHFLLAAFLCFWPYFAPGPRQFSRPWLVALGGVCLSFSVLAFPQSVGSAPVLLLGMALLGCRSRNTEHREAFWLWGRLPRGAAVLALSCLGAAAAFAVFVLRGTTLAAVLAHAQLILSDPQYDFSTAERLALLGSQASDILSFLMKPLLTALCVTVVGCSYGVYRKNVRNVRYWANVLFALWCLLTLALCILRALRDSSLDERYFCVPMVLAGLWWFRHGRGTLREPLFWLGYLPGVVAYLFILRSTLLGLSATLMYLTWPAFCALLALCLQAQERTTESPQSSSCARYALGDCWALSLLGLFLVFLLFCRSFLVLTTGWKPANVSDTKMTALSTGPAAGTWADAATADLYFALEQALASHAQERVLLSTGDVHGLAYLMADGSLRFGQASVISSTDSDTRFASYYTEQPDKIPDVIVYNDNCVRNLADFHTWLEENLTITEHQTVTVGTASLEVLSVKGFADSIPSWEAAGGTAAALPAA